MAHRTPTGATMTKRRPKALKIPRVCVRCHKRLDTRTVRESWVMLRDGFVESTVCLECTSVEELADLVILEACTEAALNIRDGRVLVRDKFRTPTG